MLYKNIIAYVKEYLIEHLFVDVIADGIFDVIENIKNNVMNYSILAVVCPLVHYSIQNIIFYKTICMGKII